MTPTVMETSDDDTFGRENRADVSVVNGAGKTPVDCSKNRETRIMLTKELDDGSGREANQDPVSSRNEVLHLRVRCRGRIQRT